ncbi:MAG: BsaWI family type II restriction enzyme [Actinomycetes bacterium]
MASPVTNYLSSHGLILGSGGGKAVDIILDIQPSLNYFAYTSPSKYVEELMDKIESHPDFTRDTRGRSFELVVACALIREDILPFYFQAEVMFVPLANFDLLIYTQELGPVILSMKTSLRERYKQAEFESQALRAVHRRAKTFLVTLDQEESDSVNEKINLGELFAIDRVLVATHHDFDELITYLKSLTPIPSPTVSLITHGRLIE